MTDRLQRQLAFLLEVDKLKQIFRQTYLLDETRKENDAEHSWHFAMFAIVLAEYAPAPVDMLKVIKMALVHDLVEIDAGDTFLYDEAGQADKAEREAKAADRIFALLPEEQGGELRALWEEFEAKETPEAKFAGAMDRIQPFLHNCHTCGRAWREHGIAADRVLQSNSHIAIGAPVLWDCVRELVEQMVAEGYIKKNSGMKLVREEGR